MGSHRLHVTSGWQATPWCHPASVLIEALTACNDPMGWQWREAQPHPPPRRDSVPSAEHLCAPWLTSHTPLPTPSVSPSLALCRLWQGPRGCQQGHGGAWVPPGSHSAAHDALLAPAVAPQVGCTPELLQKPRPPVGDAALGPRPHVGRMVLVGQRRAGCSAFSRRAPVSTANRWPGCRTWPRGCGVPRLPERLRVGGGLASPNPTPGLLEQEEGPRTVVRLPRTRHRGPHKQEAALGLMVPSFLGRSFSRVLATGPAWEPAPETQFLRSSTQPGAAQRRELLLFTGPPQPCWPSSPLDWSCAGGEVPWEPYWGC